MNERKGSLNPKNTVALIREVSQKRYFKKCEKKVKNKMCTIAKFGGIFYPLIISPPNQRNAK
jgi:hypothetical protein